MERLHSVNDVASMLQVSPRTAYKYMSQMAHLTRPLRVTESSLRAWIAQNTAQPGETHEKIRAKRGKNRSETYRIPRRRN